MLLSTFIILSSCLVVSGMMLKAVEGFQQNDPQGTASSLLSAMDDIAKLGTTVLVSP
jgi:hypothetical protein